MPSESDKYAAFLGAVLVLGLIAVLGLMVLYFVDPDFWCCN